MREAPRQDGIAALRQRLFFAYSLLKLAERELAGDAINRQAVALGCRNAAVLQLHAVLTGFLDDVVVRLRLEPSVEVPSVASTRAALAAGGLTSPELGRLEVLLESGGWLRQCEDEARRCLSSRPGGRRDEVEAHDHDHDHEHGHEGAAPAVRRIALVADAVADDVPLSAGDFARIRTWIDGWKELLDEFLITLAEF